MFCANCGQEIPDGTKFCPFCGANTGAAAPAQQPQPDYGYAPQQTPQYGGYQQGYGQQAAPQGYYQGYQAPAPEPKKSNKKLLIIILIIVGVLLIGFLVWFLFLRGGSGGGSSPEATIKNFERALNDLDFDGMVACMDSETRMEAARYGLGSQINAMASVMKSLGLSFDIEETAISYSSPTTCNVSLTLTYSMFGLSYTDTSTAKMIMEADGNWYFDGSDFDLLESLGDILSQ